ncbi:hypothetical protein D0847_08405 [Bordetella avium]|nr:hypothetical protein C0J07_16855 [Bordetella avium]RIQ15260.1 hypothetical protein D0432_03820 [Bordetella avium]RIQ19936.1 hypothetical protein D0850_01795 [Bordetella avium]RIQ43169.1 hypothetical protein D0847_08405 [Bordetella avium]RIQ56064.1 hypothetical protein D0844_03940 [Bordetella avium]
MIALADKVVATLSLKPDSSNRLIIKTMSQLAYRIAAELGCKQPNPANVNKPRIATSDADPL